MKEYTIDFNVIDWVSSAPGLRYKLIELADRSLKLAEFSEGFRESDWCKNGHTGYVIGGQGRVIFHNGKETIFEKGDIINIPTGEEHEHKAVIVKGKRLLVLFFDVR